MKILEVFVTFPGREKAAEVARILVEARVAACVNICDGIHSVYRWKSKVEEDREALAIIKTSEEKFQLLTEAIRKHHPYELPAITAVEVAHVPQSVREWIRESLNL